MAANGDRSRDRAGTRHRDGHQPPLSPTRPVATRGRTLPDRHQIFTPPPNGPPQIPQRVVMPAPASAAAAAPAPADPPHEPTPPTNLQAILAAVTAGRTEAQTQFSALGSSLEQMRHILENIAAAVAGLQSAQATTDQRVQALAEHQTEAAMRIEHLEQRVSQLADPAFMQPAQDTQLRLGHRPRSHRAPRRHTPRPPC